MYNLSSIMKKAWQIFKQSDLTFAECLKMAWRNAKAIAKALAENGTKEMVHTWNGWREIGKEVIHESKCLFQVVVEDLTTRKGTRVLSYFGASQVCDLGTQE